jgi:hypothetical protein
MMQLWMKRGRRNDANTLGWVSGAKLSTYLFSWGWSFFELFMLVIVKFSSIASVAT